MPSSSNTRNNEKRTRQRGVRASRAKLEQALRQSGFKTQAALAEKIASIEGIDSAPRDLVSKAFREILIEPQSLERIAAALNVKAYTLYQSSEDKERSTSLPDEPTSESRPKTRVPLYIGLGLLIVFLAGIGFLSQGPSSSSTFSLPGLKKSLLIYPQDKQLYLIAEKLSILYSEQFQVTVVPLALNSFQESPSDLIKSFQSDWVLMVESISVGRYNGIRLYLSDGTFEQVLSVENISQQDQLDTLYSTPYVQERLKQDTNLLVRTKKPIESKAMLSLGQQRNYLKARELIEDYQSFEALNEAQHLIEQLLRDHPFYGPAHGLLCEISIHESWRENEKARLEQATKQCHQANSLSPNNLYVQTVLGFLHDKTGQRDLARSQFETLLQEHPSNVEALMGLATVYFNMYRSSGDKDELNQALGFARQAALVLEDYWRPFQLLAIMEFYSGNKDNAIKAWESLVAIKPNELILSNLGFMYLCKSELDVAQEKFEAARQLAPQSYMPLEGLSAIHYYQGDYQRALDLRLEVQELIGNQDAGIHQQWGGLAEAYRQLNRLEEAKEASRTALKILERDHLRDNTSLDDQMYRLYYQIQLIADSQNQEQWLSELEKLSNNELSPPAHLRKALAFKLLDETTQANVLLEEAAEHCPVYRLSPDFR